ncbi:TonB-dependent receptor [Phenylobacterium sp.]|uniref:TonB-dependent receptor n=1 Tax=Phenylobacterium sp. TaxID=1871053 RepID=UPI0035B1A259
MGAHTKIRAPRRAALLAATAGAALAAATGAAAQTGGSADHARELGEVVVTASRREASVRDTPIALSAYGGDQLEKEHVETFSALVTQSPNIQLGTSGANTNIAIRGIGTNLQTAGNDPGVAFHVDGIYVPDTAIALASLFDVNRVEVLRGPQGTLFGRNATGGAVNVISNTPTASPAFGLDASVGAPVGEHVAMFASGPINAAGTLLGRAAVQQTYRRGAVENVAPGGPDRLEGKNNYGGRLQLEWRPTADFSARLLADYQKSDETGPAYYLVGTPNADLGLPALLSNTFIATPSDDRIAVTHGAANLMEKGVALFVDWKIVGGDLRATVSRRHTKVYTENDGDGTAVDFDSTIFDQSRDTTYAELLYSSDADRRFSYILGANYIDDSETQAIAVPVIYLPAPVTITGDVDTRSAAVFGHAEYKLTDAWKVFGGARMSRDKKRLTESNNFIGALTQSDRWSKPTFEIGTSYEFSSTSTGYLKYATGYKSGGYSAGGLAPAFAPETSKMWELGLKGAYFDGRLEANLALFRTSYQNLQVNQVVGVLSQVTNAAAATINGAEIELVQHVTPEFRIAFDGGWLDARFDRFITEDSARPALGTLNLEGNRLPQAPEFTAGIGPVYSHVLGDGGELTLAARYDWKSRVYFSEFNLPLISQGASGRVNAYATYEAPGGRWRFGLYGRNLTDERTYATMVVGSAVINSITNGTIQPRREVGVELHYRY